MAVQIAVALGCRVIGTAGSAAKCDYVRTFGVAECIDYTQDKWWDQVLKATGNKGADVVFDPVGLVDRTLKCIAHRGRVVVVGFAGTEGQIEKIAMNRLLLKQVSVIGYVSSCQSFVSKPVICIEADRFCSGMAKLYDGIPTNASSFGTTSRHSLHPGQSNPRSAAIIMD